MKKYFKIIPLVILFFIFLFKVIIPQLKINNKCVTYNDFLKLKLNGAVINKYIDSSQHSYKTIEIMNRKDSTATKLILDLDTTGLFNRIFVDDTIYKEKNNDSIFLKRDNRTYFLSRIDFGCDR